MNTLEKLREIYQEFNPNFDSNLIKEDSVILKDLGLNSIGLLYLIVEIQKHFNIDISKIDFTKIITVKDLIDYIES